jgi:multidrug efflux pump subunit AcrA (membrane-fusion protein)
LETKLNKYNLRAPFNGVLTETTVTNGSLVRAGQKLGEFIDTSIFELEVNINEAYAYLMKKGNKVTVSSLSKSTTWEAVVVRVNAKVNQTTQTVKVFLQVKGEGLKDGMYLNADLQTKKIDNAIEISRRLLVDNSKVYTVKDSILELVDVNPVYFGNETVVVKGLENGTAILAKSLPGAYEGMLVKTLNDKE